MDGGLARFQARMKAIPEAVRLGVQPALLQSGGEVAAAIRGLAPVDTGALKESVTVTGPGQATPPYSQPGGSMVVPVDAVAVTEGNSDVRYAHLVEYGTGGRMNTGGSQATFNPGTVAQPHFWPGFRMTRDRAQRRIKAAISKAVKDNWGK